MLPWVIMAYLKAYEGNLFGLLSFVLQKMLKNSRVLKKTTGNLHKNIIQRLEASTEMN